MKKLALLLLISVLFGCPTPNGPQDTFTDIDSKWFTGTTSPGSSLGVDGDLYMDTVTGNVYVKIDGNWVSVANIQGPEGPTGDDGLQGPEGPPGPGLQMFTHVVTSTDWTYSEFTFPATPDRYAVHQIFDSRISTDKWVDVWWYDSLGEFNLRFAPDYSSTYSTTFGLIKVGDGWFRFNWIGPMTGITLIIFIAEVESTGSLNVASVLSGEGA